MQERAMPILAEFLALHQPSLFPSSEWILTTDFSELRACGFSARKIETIRAIAEGSLNGLVLSRTLADQMSY
jgi:DNA-3-methyladenine glycosylase II